MSLFVLVLELINLLMVICLQAGIAVEIRLAILSTLQMGYELQYDGISHWDFKFCIRMSCCFYSPQYMMVFYSYGMWSSKHLVIHRILLPLSIHNVPHLLFIVSLWCGKLECQTQSSVNKRAFVYSHGSGTIVMIAMSPYAAGQL